MNIIRKEIKDNLGKKEKNSSSPMTGYDSHQKINCEKGSLKNN